MGAAAFAGASVGYVWLITPDVRPLRTNNPRTTAFMERRADEARAAERPVRARRTWVPLVQISPLLQRAIVVSEDAAFWDHTGIDVFEVRAALVEGLGDGEFRGASTITQQLAKNLYLTPSRSPGRKLVELFLARRLEAELSKRRIFEL